MVMEITAWLLPASAGMAPSGAGASGVPYHNAMPSFSKRMVVYLSCLKAEVFCRERGSPAGPVLDGRSTEPGKAELAMPLQANPSMMTPLVSFSRRPKRSTTLKR